MAPSRRSSSESTSESSPARPLQKATRKLMHLLAGDGHSRLPSALAGSIGLHAFLLVFAWSRPAPPAPEKLIEIDLSEPEPTPAPSPVAAPQVLQAAPKPEEQPVEPPQPSAQQSPPEPLPDLPPAPDERPSPAPDPIEVEAQPQPTPAPPKPEATEQADPTPDPTPEPTSEPQSVPQPERTSESVKPVAKPVTKPVNDPESTSPAFSPAQPVQPGFPARTRRDDPARPDEPNPRPARTLGAPGGAAGERPGGSPSTSSASRRAGEEQAGAPGESPGGSSGASQSGGRPRSSRSFEERDNPFLSDSGSPSPSGSENGGAESVAPRSIARGRRDSDGASNSQISGSERPAGTRGRGLAGLPAGTDGETGGAPTFNRRALDGEQAGGGRGGTSASIPGGLGGSGGTGGRFRPRSAAAPFGDPGGGNGGRGGGTGGSGGGAGRGDGGNGGPGRSPRFARRGDGNGNGNGEGSGGNNGRGGNGGRGGRLPGGLPGGNGGNGDGTGGGNGSGGGNGGSGGGRGRGGGGNGDGEQAGGGNGGGGRGGRGGEGAGGGRFAGMGLGLGMGRGRLRREGEEGREIGRGIWDPGLVGTYYLDPERGQLEPGHPIDWATLGAPGSKKFATRTSKTIDFNWGEKPPLPGGRGTYWSVRWVGRIFVPKDDEYEFFLDNVDDGGRLYLDGNKLLDVWRVQRSTPKSDKMFLKSGPHPIVLEYAQGPATASSVRLMWRSSSFPKELVGAYIPGGTR